MDATNKTYIGIEKVIAVIRSDEIVNFDELNVHFKNICFDDNYESVLLYNEAQSAYEAKDYKTALEKYKRSANLGCKKAMSKVASMYHKGEGTNKTLNEAVNWYTKAIELGDTKSMVELVHIYRDDNSETIQQDFQKMAEYFKQAADAGDSDGMYCLGMLYKLVSEDDVVEDKNEYKKDMINEFSWRFSRALVSSLHEVFEVFRVPKKEEKVAFEWFLKAAKAGNILGMVNA